MLSCVFLCPVLPNKDLPDEPTCGDRSPASSVWTSYLFNLHECWSINWKPWVVYLFGFLSCPASKASVTFYTWPYKCSPASFPFQLWIPLPAPLEIKVTYIFLNALLSLFVYCGWLTFYYFTTPDTAQIINSNLFRFSLYLQRLQDKKKNIS